MRRPKPRKTPEAVQLDDTAIRKLADLARLPEGADLERFARNIRNCLAAYRSNALSGRAVDHFHDAHELYDLARRAVKTAVGFGSAGEELASKLATLPPSNRGNPGERPNLLALLEERVQAPGFEGTGGVPTPDELRSAASAQEASQRLMALLAVGQFVKDGRSRPGGRQSQSTLERRLLLPKAHRPGRPIDDLERTLVLSVAHAYWEATGKLPPKRSDSRNPGPFARLVQAVLGAADMGHVDAVEVVNRLRIRP